VTLLITAMTSGCTLLASANANHMHHGGCMDTPVPASIDLVIGAVTTVALLATGKVDESAAWLIPGGVFLTTGVIGSITAYSCRHNYEPTGVAAQGTPAQYYGPPTMTGTATTTGLDPPEPTARDATAAEIGLPPPSTPKADLRLGPGYTPTHPAPPAEDPRVKCQIHPVTVCPDKQSCVLVEGDHGYCVPDR
jgi:hypothetical protein